jgi:hypothetical protein
VQNNYLLTAQGSFDVIHPAPTACNYAAADDVQLTAYGKESGAPPSDFPHRGCGRPR